MKKKVLGILVTSAIVGTMLMGCGSGSKGTTTAAPAAAVEDSAKAQDPKPGESAQETPAAETEAVTSEGFNPDKEAGVSIEDVRERFPMAARKLLQARLQNSSRTNTGVH